MTSWREKRRTKGKESKKKKMCILNQNLCVRFRIHKPVSRIKVSRKLATKHFLADRGAILPELD